MQEPQTLPQHYLKQVARYGDGKVALRQKELGIWQEHTWADSYANVRAFALGLITLGVRRGDKIATIGDNDRQYLWGYLGLQAAGAIQVGIYTDAIADEAAYIIAHSDSTFVLAQDQEQCDKMLAIRERIPTVKKVIYWDEKGLWHYDEPWLISFGEVQALGEALAAKEPERFEMETRLGRKTDLAVICYTSGTTDLPKGVMLSHGNVITASRLMQEVDGRYPTDNHISIIPLGWIGEHVLGIAPHCLTGVILNFPEEPETVGENIREIAPEVIFYNSRLWESLVGMIKVNVDNSTWLNRQLYRRFLPIGYRMADKKFGRETVSLRQKLAYRLGDLAVFGPLRDKLGLINVRTAYTAGAALSPDVIRFFHALGINLKQVYGSTEVTGGLTMHRNDDIKFASVGRPLPETAVYIDPATSEILLSGPVLFHGYYKDPEATAAAITVDEAGVRWFHTGDAGYVDKDGHLIYLDRVKDMITLANGERFSPQFIEGRLKFSPYIRDVMAIGDPSREFVTALVVIDYGNVGNWAERRGLGYTTFIDLAQKPAVYDLIEQAVRDVNRSLPENGRVGRFILMHKEFDADEAEMTRTRKLRRGVIYDKYGDIIAAMYANEDSVAVRAAVIYQDGSEGVVETSLKIVSLT